MCVLWAMWRGLRAKPWDSLGFEQCTRTSLVAGGNMACSVFYAKLILQKERTTTFTVHHI